MTANEAASEAAGSDSEPSRRPAQADAESPAGHTAIPSLGRQTAGGLFWMVLQSLGTRAASLLGQLALAWLLMPEHFAAISLTWSVVAFARVLESGGLREVLVYRGTRFTEWANAGFWLSLALGIGSAAIVLGAAPLAARMYDSPLVGALLCWFAVVPVLTGLATVPMSRLQSEHRFRELAGLAALLGCVQPATTVLFAWLGMGAYSFAWGTLSANGLHTLLAWRLAPVAVLWNPEFQRWRALGSGTLSLSLTALVTTVLQQVDYMLLGIYQSKLAVGLYYMAYSVASQASHLLGSNLALVFLPVLSKLQDDPVRQLAAARRALTTLAGITIPFAFFQCGLIDPAFRLFLPPRWIPAIPYARVLSLGLGLTLLASLCWSLIKAQGRFNTILLLNTAGALFFSTGVYFAARYGTPLTVSWCVLGLALAYVPVVIYLGLRPIGGTWGDVADVMSMPMMLSVLAILPAWLVEGLIPDVRFRDFWRLVSTGFVFCSIYAMGLVVTGHPAVGEVRRLAAMRLGRWSAG